MPSTAPADPGYSTQVAELRPDRPRSSSKATAPRIAILRAPGLTPPRAEPSPQFIALAAAAQIVSFAQSNVADQYTTGNAGAFVDTSSLKLVNDFLDYLLWSFLLKARSTKLRKVRRAVKDTLAEHVAQKAVPSADDALSEHVIGDIPLLAEPNDDGDEGEEEADWDIQQSWQQLRLRCMVYTRFGDMEEEDEEEYLDPSSGIDTGNPIHVPPETAIFLTSILEFIGERSLIAAGEAAFVRTESEKPRMEGGDLEDSGFETKTPPTPRRLVVQDEDLQKLTNNPLLGEQWTAWQQALKEFKPLPAMVPAFVPRLVHNSQALNGGCVPVPIGGNRRRSSSLQEGKAQAIDEVPEVAVHRVSQHGRSQSLWASPEAKERVLRSHADQPLPEQIPVPSALDSVEIDKPTENACWDNNEADRDSPDLSYYLEESRKNRQSCSESFVTASSEPHEQREEKDDKLPWLVPRHKKGNNDSTVSDCTSLRTRPPATALSTTYSLRRMESTAGSSGGKKPTSLSTSCRPITPESTSSPVSSIFRQLKSRTIIGESSDAGSEWDEILHSDGTIHLTLTTGRMRDMESRRTAQGIKLPASAAREASTRNSASLKDLADFIRYTGPDEDKRQRPTTINPVAVCAGSQATPGGNNTQGEPPAKPVQKRRFEPRDATYGTNEGLYELAEFIRRGPPGPHGKQRPNRSEVSLETLDSNDTGVGGPSLLEADCCACERVSQDSSVATRPSNLGDQSSLSTFEDNSPTSARFMHGSNPYTVDTDDEHMEKDDISLAEFLRSNPITEEDISDPKLLSAPMSFSEFERSPSSTGTNSTLRGQLLRTDSPASERSSTKLSSASAVIPEFLSSASIGSLKNPKKLLRKQKGSKNSPYRDSPYPDRDTPYGVELERTKRLKGFPKMGRLQGDLNLPPVPSALSADGHSLSSSSTRRSYHSGSAKPLKLLNPSNFSNMAKDKVMFTSVVDDATGQKKQPRTITKLFKKQK